MDKSVKNYKELNFYEKGYILVRISVDNQELFKQYPPLSGPIMEKYGGNTLLEVEILK